MTKGWISIHRKLQCHWLWGDKPFSKGQAWVDLLMLANHEDCKFLLGSQLVEARRGEVITSELKLMDRWGWSKTKVRSFLEMLEIDSMLVKKTDQKKTTLTLVNYGVWQDIQTEKKPQKDQAKTTEGPHEDQAKTTRRPSEDTINNSNNSNHPNNPNNNNKILGEFFESIWKLYPKKEGKGQVSKSQKEKLHKIGIEEMTRSIERYIKAKSGKDKQYLQNGSTFFNTGYVDYLDANYQEEVKEVEDNSGNPWDDDPYIQKLRRSQAQ